MELLRRGKVKEVYALDSQRLLFKFTDNISVFDKIIPTQIPFKGESLCRTATFWFRKIGATGIKNHFIQARDSEMIVKRFRIVEQAKNGKGDYLIPLEFITRYYVAGSLYDRLRDNKLDFHKLGFSKMPQYGEILPEPFFEITTKFEEYDRKVNWQEAAKIGGLEKSEIEEIREIILKIDKIIHREVEKRGLIHVDGKKEFALDKERDIFVVDTFGTLDEDRWWDKEKYEKGEIVQLSKEFVRQYYRGIGYYEKLQEARRKGIAEPPIPPLPEDMVEKVAALYRDTYTRITGEPWD